MLKKIILKKRIVSQGLGLALGGGASRGFFHIGLLKALEEYQISIKYIAGISIGSLIGGLYAYGYSADEILDILDQNTQPLSLINSISPTFNKDGLFTGKGMVDLLNKLVDYQHIENFKIPFACRAVDVENFKEVILDKGNAGLAIKASCAIPGIFTPEKVNTGTGILVDGGALGGVPFALLRSKFSGPMLASNLISYDNLSSSDAEKFSDEIAKNVLCKLLPSTELLIRSFYLMQTYISELEVEKFKPEIYIQFKGLYNPHIMNIKEVKDTLVNDGYQQTKKILENIF